MIRRPTVMYLPIEYYCMDHQPRSTIDDLGKLDWGDLLESLKEVLVADPYTPTGAVRYLATIKPNPLQ